MNSKIYAGKIMHCRLRPVKHRFDYPAYFYAFDLNELPRLDEDVLFFSRNRFNLVSLWDKDYLDRGQGDMRSKLLRYLADHGCAGDIDRVVLVTCARFFGYVFNPVSFFYCYSRGGDLRCVVAQVNNTFGESHLYVLKDKNGESAAFAGHYESAKEFHVSPFFDRTGNYEFKLSAVAEKIAIQVNLFKEGQPALISELSGKAKELNNGNLLSVLVRFPLTALLTVPRIHWQAARLYFQRKLPAFKKPVPKSPMTIRRALPNWLQRICAKAIYGFLSRIRRGTLKLVLPDGSVKLFGGQEPGIDAQMNVHHYNFFWRIAKDAGIGLGEGFMEEDWSTPDLVQTLNLLIANKPYLSSKESVFDAIGNRLNRLRHLSRRNSLKGSQKNIHDHYDLGNEFFRLFLDSTMTYSCALFNSEDDTLEEAQIRKLDTLIKKAKISADCHVLEIGCGWGGFAIRAAETTGCRVTCLTLSQEQRKLAEERILEAGLQDKIDVQICDYRKMRGQFDRIVSIEMLEAVGHEFFGAFFQACDRLLKPAGLVVIQSITIPDQRYDSYRRGCDWIQKYIFPGGHLPALSALCESMTRHSKFFVEDMENIGVHYALTLRNWRERFLARSEEVKVLGFPDRTLRAWEYYFAYCEAGFASRYLNDIHLVLTREANATLNTQGDFEHATDSGYAAE